MTHRTYRPRIALLSACLLTASAGLASAQTGPDLLLGQFGAGNNVVGQAEAIFQNSGHTDHTDAGGSAPSGQLFIYNASARFKLDLDNVVPGFSKAQPRAGFQTTVLDIHSSDPSIPDTLTDMSFGIGLGLAKTEKWVAGASVGLGYASANVFNDGQGLYAKADLAFAYELNDKEKIGIVLDYNGNRVFMPDVPLPGFIYTRKLNDQFTLEVGFPYSDIQYQPNDDWTFMLKFNFPDGGEANVDYKVTQSFHLYGSLTQQNEAFAWNRLDNPNDRIIFSQSRGEVGVRGVAFDEKLAFTAALGYAWGTQFDVGFDSRDTDGLVGFSDEPYVRVGVEVKF